MSSRDMVDSQGLMS